MITLKVLAKLQIIVGVCVIFSACRGGESVNISNVTGVSSSLVGEYSLVECTNASKGETFVAAVRVDPENMVRRAFITKNNARVGNEFDFTHGLIGSETYMTFNDNACGGFFLRDVKLSEHDKGEPDSRDWRKKQIELERGKLHTIEFSQNPDDYKDTSNCTFRYLSFKIGNSDEARRDSGPKTGFYSLSSESGFSCKINWYNVKKTLPL